ncbi:CRE-CLEC-188 protein [Caenorhabditis remanei]|uniref:CRE-CLEC-188 protein n=1 Tax=Caenorhabditis remanei TaxID=31234 RepID=E3N2C3_CAERE|nr:CRE-CLEC-188 protein [Caenorhabditis remanei]
MKFLLFLASLLLVVDSVMVVVNGKPDPSSKANQNPNATSWEKCVKYCSEEVTCLLAYDNEGKCEWFQHENITKVKQTTVLEEEKVAFKVNNFSTSSCPSGLNPPTFDNQDAHGVLLIPGEYDNPNRVNYTIKYTAGTWEFSYFEQNACPTDFFVLLQRENIQWCMSTEITPDRPFTSFSYDAAVTTCDNQNGSVLTGATNAAEMEKIKTMQSNLLSWGAVPQESFALRLDGKRTTACQATPRTASCMTDEVRKGVHED